MTTEISFELDGEQERVVEAVTSVLEQQVEDDIDVDEQAKQAFVQHALEQYQQIVLSQ